MRTHLEIAEAFSPAERLTAERPFYLVGIGGAGMSSLAFMLHKRGIPVSGSDSTESPTTASLRDAGIPVRIGHSGGDIQAGYQVVLSDAIDLKISPEVAAARRLGCELFRRSQLLNWLLKGKKIIAVTGTHGKTTVTGMIGAGLRAAEMDPTIVVGAYVPEFGASVVEGAGEYAVVEACEAYNAFLDLDPFIVVLTNLEPDHLDFHGSFESLNESVRKFLSTVPATGQILYCAEARGAEVVASGFSNATAYDRFDRTPEMPGEHNAWNASGALLACIYAGADPDRAVYGVFGFRGAERRLQTVFDGKVTIVDDYAHHPSEIRASIQALHERFPGRRVVVAFQPHLYSRTAENIEAFAAALDESDHVVLTDIYPAREPCMPGVSSARIAEHLKTSYDYVPARQLLARHLALIAEPFDVLVMMGAGNIGDHVHDLVVEVERRFGNRKTRVAVVLGGDSAEREVSFHSGNAILRALDDLGYDAFPVDFTYMIHDRGDLGEILNPIDRPDIAFLAVHGTHAEDGAIQGLLEILHIPYTGSGIQSSALCMDKQRTKTILEAHGLPVPKGLLVQRSEDQIDLKPPVIVKPNAQGSTVGLSFVRMESELKPAIEKALHYGSGALVEEWIQGMEISVPVLGGKALPPVEIVPKSGQYDFAAKYEPGATEEICPARLPEAVLQKAMRMAELAHAAMGCEGATRTDFIVKNNEEPIVLEVNTLPGMTGTSLLPKSAQSAGMSFEDLVDWIAKDALERHAASR